MTARLIRLVGIMEDVQAEELLSHAPVRSVHNAALGDVLHALVEMLSRKESAAMLDMHASQVRLIHVSLAFSQSALSF
jgi:hypothetical protein